MTLLHWYAELALLIFFPGTVRAASNCFHCASLRFVSDWVYSGVFRDVYGEFMIQVNEEYLGFRGETTHTRCRINTLASVSRFWKWKGCQTDCLAENNWFHYSLYCLVGFVLVSIKDVMKLLDDNQWETESATTAVGTRAILRSVSHRGKHK